MMKSARRFLVYRSVSHTYVRYLLAVFPLLSIVLADYTGFSFLYLAAAVLFLASCPFLTMLYSVLKVDNNGLHLLRPFRKTWFIPWEDVLCSGTIRKPYVGGQKSFELLYFSKKPVAAQTLLPQISLPQLTEDFLFAAVQPGLQEAIETARPSS